MSVLYALVSVSFLPCLATLLLGPKFHAKWINWILIWLAVMSVPFFVTHSKKVDRFKFVFLSASLFPLGLAAMLIANSPFLSVGLLILAIWHVGWWGYARRKKINSPSVYRNLVLSFLCWTACYYYFAWTYNIHTKGISALVAVLLASVVILVFIPNVSRKTTPLKKMTPALSWGIGATLVGAFIFESLRIDRIEQVNFVHHWGVYIGTIQHVWEQGWLLWDTPSQYGFLNIALLAALPFKTAWSSLYWVNAFCVALQAALIFFFIWRLWPTIGGALSAFALTFFSTFLIAGWLPEGTGPASFPSVNAFRFLWVVSTLIFVCLGKKNQRLIKLRWFPVGENALFVVSMLWSPDSFFYCGLIWTSYYWGEWLGLPQNRKNSFKEIGMKSGALGASVILISAYYRLALGYFPDWFMFFEYAVAFGTGFGSIRMIFPGPAFLFLYIAFITSLIMINWSIALRPRLGIILACFSVLWGCATYYVARSHPNNATNLAPLVVVALSGLLHAVSNQRRIKLQLLAWISPVIASIYLTAVLNQPMLISYVKRLGNAQFFEVEQLLPEAAQEVKLLIKNIPNPETARLVSWAGDNLLGKDGDNFFSHSWLPLAPMTLAYPIRPHRRTLYIKRKASRISGCGWVLYGSFYPREAEPVSEFEKILENLHWGPTQSFKQGTSELVEWCQETQ